MSGSDKRFIIPIYQRNYAWKEENCNQLYEDIFKLVSMNENGSHFLGCITDIRDTNSQYQSKIIIDGQQRLTTISIFLAVIYDLIDDNQFPEMTDPLRKENLKNQIKNEFLIDPYGVYQEARIKLKTVQDDDRAFQAIIDGGEHIPNSNISKNYNYFRYRIIGDIQDERLTGEGVFNAFKKLQIVHIELDAEHDDAQLIFESLNSTGLELEESDKIRNFVFMGFNQKEQRDIYSRYWRAIEQRTKNIIVGKKTFDAFIRDYLSIKQQKTKPSKLANLYFDFKNYVKINRIDLRQLLEDMLKYAKQYEKLLAPETVVEDRELKGCISRLNRLDITTPRVFLLEILKLNEDNRISDEDLKEIFNIIESYVVRRMICDVPSHGLDVAFLKLLIYMSSFDSDYKEKIMYKLLSCSENSDKFPTDEEFKTAWSNKSIYEMKHQSCVYVLERFENMGTRETRDFYEHIDQNDYSIEHIMPQTLTDDWKEKLGENYEEIYNFWCHKLANLTFTAYNSQYSNLPFSEKRDMENGFKQSAIRLNSWIAQQDKWDEDKLRERNLMLVEASLSIWPYPQTTYHPQDNLDQYDQYCLNDTAVQWKYREIHGYKIKDKQESADSWSDAYSKILKSLYEKSPTTILDIIQNPETYNNFYKNLIKSTNEGLRTSEQLAEGVFIEKNTSTEYKISIINNLFELFDLDPQEMIFFLVKKDNDIA